MQLVRLPNVFTAPTNVLAGYFVVTPISELNYASMTILMVSSGLLYASGVIFNDYFDIEIDRKERPSRPLPSGSISKRRGLKIAIVLMVSALVLAFFVSWSSFAVAISLACVILAYDYKLKHNNILSPVTMGGSRFLNVIMGSSPAFQLQSHLNLFQPIFVASSLFTFVVIIVLFSRKELSGIKLSRQIIALFSIVYAIIVAISIATLLGLFKPWSFVVLVPFVVIISIFLKQTISGDVTAIQRAIKNLVISIIILDSIFVCGSAGLLYGLPILLFLIPSGLLSRKFYVT